MTLRFAILTISDRSSRGERPDSSGPALVELVQSKGWQVVRQDIVPDEMNAIQDTLRSWADGVGVDVVLTVASGVEASSG